MGDLTPSERLQPFLLDRLIDDNPKSLAESRDSRVVSISQLREIIIRDMAWLLNSRSYLPVKDLIDFPEVTKSVINYGVRDLAGFTTDTYIIAESRKMILAALQTYEPRLLSNSISVNPLGSSTYNDYNVIGFEIRGDMWALPAPEGMYIKTKVDLETGQCELKDSGRG